MTDETVQQAEAILGAEQPKYKGRELLEIADDLNSAAKDGESVAYFISIAADLDDIVNHGAGMLADLFKRVGELSEELWAGHKAAISVVPSVDATRGMLRSLEAQCETLTEAQCVDELARGEWEVQKLLDTPPGYVGDAAEAGYMASHNWSLKGLRHQVALERFKEALLPPEESRAESAALENELAQSVGEAMRHIEGEERLASAPASRLQTAAHLAHALLAAIRECTDDNADAA